MSGPDAGPLSASAAEGMGGGPGGGPGWGAMDASRIADSPSTSPRIDSFVKPSVFITPISLVRSRIDMAIVFAATRMIVKVTAAQMDSSINLMFPMKARKLNAKACSDSVRVATSELNFQSKMCQWCRSDALHWLENPQNQLLWRLKCWTQ